MVGEGRAWIRQRRKRDGAERQGSCLDQFEESPRENSPEKTGRVTEHVCCLVKVGMSARGSEEKLM